MQSTLLSVLISRMQRWRDIANVEEQYLVRDLDSSIRELRRNFQFPWTLQKGSLKVFNEVDTYPVASDHDEMAYIEKDNIETYSQTARFFNTDMKQFQQNMENQRNIMTEIWDGGTKMIGLKYKNGTLQSQTLSTAETVADYAVSGDATAVAKDTVMYKRGSASMKITITSSAGTATITNDTISTFSDTKYKSKYQFRWIYLDAVPTSITMQIRTDASNYLATTVTTQFSGQALKADQWNLIAQNLDEATETGTFDNTSIAAEAIVLTGAGTGTYYLDESNLREWELMDYWYYSMYNVMLTGSTSADQEYFYNSSEVYSTDSSLIGDSEWIDTTMYDAILTGINAKENAQVFGFISRKRQDAWSEVMKKYPSLTPLITSKKYRYENNPGRWPTHGRSFTSKL